MCVEGAGDHGSCPHCSLRSLRAGNPLALRPARSMSQQCAYAGLRAGVPRPLTASGNLPCFPPFHTMAFEQAAAEMTKEAGEQANFISTLGLNWKLFLAQLVNFSVIAFVLWKWAWRPLARLMDERSEKIEKSLEDAKRIEEELRKIHEKREVILLQAKKEAKSILEVATKKADTLKIEMVREARHETEKIVAGAKLAIAHEKEQMLMEVKAHVADLVVAASEKVLQEKIDGTKDKELVEAAIKTFDN